MSLANGYGLKRLGSPEIEDVLEKYHADAATPAKVGPVFHSMATPESALSTARRRKINISSAFGRSYGFVDRAAGHAEPPVGMSFRALARRRRRGRRSSGFHLFQGVRLIERHEIGNETFGVVGGHNLPPFTRGFFAF